MTIDYLNLRNSTQCPFCKGHKDRGLIACWPCFRAEELRNGETPEQREILECVDENS